MNEPLDPERVKQITEVEVATEEMFVRGMQRGEETGLFTTVGEGESAQVVLTHDGLCVGAVIMSLLEHQARQSLFVPGREN